MEAKTRIVQQASSSHPVKSNGRPPLPGRPVGIRPAMVVLGIAALLLVAFAVGAAIAGHGTPSHARLGTAQPAPVHGTSLLAVPATNDLRAIERSGSPPANIIDSVRVPSRASVGGATDNASHAGQFDAQVSFQVPANESDVIAFYRTDMRNLGWQVVSTGPDSRHPGYQILGKKAGTDGWYWELGVTISPTVFGTSGPTANGSTAFVIRLVQLPDLQ